MPPTAPSARPAHVEAEAGHDSEEDRGRGSGSFDLASADPGQAPHVPDLPPAEPDADELEEVEVEPLAAEAGGFPP